MQHTPEDQIEGLGTTHKLCQWVSQLDKSQIPPEIFERAKYIILDGIACGLVGAKVPWSEEAAAASALFEPEGACSIIGHGVKYGPVSAALLNSTFIQACELDDYHSVAPLHSTSIILPALFAAAESVKDNNKKTDPSAPPPSGLDFLVAAIAGFETGPRVGKALNGADMLTQGWHSGPVFGGPAAAAAASRFFKLNADDTESAIGISCTQAGGLMSAQYEGMVKRMQHGFAARNGLFAALLARTGYIGIKKVFERPYGGFLKCFSYASETEPKYHIHEIAKDLGTFWEIEHIRTKMHAAVGGSHGHIECTEKIMTAYPERFTPDKLDDIKDVSIGLAAPVFAHDGWDPDVRPLTSTGGQMCCAYINATQMVDNQVLLRQFSEHELDRDEVWNLTYRTHCYHDSTFDKPNCYCGARVKVEFNDGLVVEEMLMNPKGFDPKVKNLEIVAKYRKLVIDVIPKDRMLAIEDMVLALDTLEDITKLLDLLVLPARSAFDE